MKFQPDRPEGVNLVSRYDALGVTVNGNLWQSSLILPWQGPVLAWQAIDTLTLEARHFADIPPLEPELVLLGTGPSLRFPPAAAVLPLMQRRIGVESMDTQAACRTFNILASEGRRVVAALLLGGGPA